MKKSQNADYISAWKKDSNYVNKLEKAIAYLSIKLRERITEDEKNKIMKTVESLSKEWALGQVGYPGKEREMVANSFVEGAKLVFDLLNSGEVKSEFNDIGQLTCDGCGCHPSILYTSDKGRFCANCKPV